MGLGAAMLYDACGGRSRRSAAEAQQLQGQSVLSGFWSQVLLIILSREASVVVGIWGAHSATSRSLMALKAETPLTDYSEVSSAISRFKEKEKLAADSRILHRPSAKQDGALVNPVGKGKHPVSESAGREELGNSWKQEYLVAENPDDGRLVCMVCGGLLARSGPAAARQHILQHHAHSLDFTLEEKHNILEGWSEGAVLPEKESPPSSAGGPGENQQPAEIEVLLDLEEQPVGRKRGPVPAHRAESLHLDAERRLPVRQRPPAKDPRGQEPIEAAGKEWLSECGLPGSAPAEIRIFTDGSFPAGFTLKLYCRSQPEPSPGSGAKANPRKKTVDRDCSVSLLRLHSRDAAGRLHPSPDPLAPPCPLGSSADRCPKDCGAVRGAGRRAAPTGKEASTPLGKGFNPTWRARFLVDFDAATGHLVCMVCEYPLRRICLATVKQHILQCHAETLQMPREVRRTILEVWENRSQPSTQVQRK
ncbi:spindlin interactor and repressor of chromatin-binding protein isoform X1 [Crotalus tigris]|uniref:spindlin interactor and repressor of chromatin-binding protein isoform X1 n=1 Tax=Crotalus tigris TaxID=88082 RepID=UPI00192F9CCD|nr:spindlin interactor and repressor of chromatin-binding protein isoform X1 [Crotalus tigris]